MGLFDVFKDKDEDEDSGGMAEETPSFESEPEPEETPSFESQPEETPAIRASTRGNNMHIHSLLRKQHHIHKLELQYKVSLA